MNLMELNRELVQLDFWLLEWFLKGEFEEKRILDAGCGEGRNLHYLTRNEYDIWGIDNNMLTLGYLENVIKSVNPAFDTDRFIHDSVTDIPLPSESFDVVFAMNVLQHLQSTIEGYLALKELHRVLRPHGRLYGQILVADSTIEEGGPDIFEKPNLLFDREYWFNELQENGFWIDFPYKTEVWGNGYTIISFKAGIVTEPLI